MSTKESLAWRARAGDTEAFAALYEEVYRDLYRMALYTLKNPQDAEDVVSDTVADAFASIRKLRDADAFRAWIFKILSNKCRRKLKEYVRRTEELPEEMAGGSRELAEDLAVRSAFFTLSDTDRLILSLHLFGGYTSREIGSLLKMNENTVRSRESRALKKLAAMLEE